MITMGGACSMQRHRTSSRQDMGHSTQRDRHGNHELNGRRSSERRRYSRHSVLGALPDNCISHLYPTSDNYVTEDNGLRSPKSLAELCTETLCRSLAYLDGELPPGLPPDVVDCLVASLIKHNALNARTLRILKNCELGRLSLAGCRDVTDEWLEHFGSFSGHTSPASSSSPTLSAYHPATEGHIESMDLDDHNPTPHVHPFRNIDFTTAREQPTEVIYPSTCGNSRTTESQEHKNEHEHQYCHHTEGSNAIIHGDESSCSTSSFVSASSTPFVAAGVSTTTHMATYNSMLELPILSCHNGTDESQEDYKKVAASNQPPHILPFMDPLPSLSTTASSITANMTHLDLRGSQRLTDRGLIQLSDLSNLEVVRLDNCYSLTGRGLLAFSMSHHLHTLSLANCRRLTDEAIINISHLHTLEALSLDGCRCLTDRSMAALSGLIHLRKLDLSQCDLVTDSGLEDLEHLEELEELSLGWCRLISDTGLDILSRQPGRSDTLRILSLARCPIEDTGVEYLARFRALEELDLNGCSNVGSWNLGKTLGQLPHLGSIDVSYCPGILRTSWQGRINSLKRLDLCYSGVRDSHISKFSELTSLEELNLDSCPVGDWAISHLADNNVVPNLTSLDLADTDLSDLGMVHIAKFQNLKRLSLFYCNISNGGLRHLAQLTCLEVLNLDSREIGDDGLWHLRNLKGLKSLDIFSGRITDSGCSHIARIKSLESLELCGGGVGDLGCTMLSTLTNLKSLNLSQNERITNRGAVALASLSSLKALNLSNTRVTSAALTHFRDLMQLQSLALYGCRGMENSRGLDHLQNGLPSLKCVRLNTKGSDEDGIIRNLSVDETDDESDMEGFEREIDSIDARRSEIFSFQNEDSDDEDSEMDDVDQEGSHSSRSDSSYYSDHDY